MKFGFLFEISSMEVQSMPEDIIPSAFGGIVRLSLLLHFVCKKQVSQIKNPVALNNRAINS